MTLYIVLLFIIIIIYPLFGKKKNILQGESITLNSKIYIYINSFILSMVLGLRNISVGIDTNTYYNIFNNIKFLTLSEAMDVKIEHGYRLLQFIIGRVFGDFQYLLIIVAILYICVVSYYIYKYSDNPMFSYILFIVFGFYTFAMSATRQTIAISLVMIAFKFIEEKKIVKFVCFVLLASSFHITALIFLPCYWFNKLELNVKTILLLTSIGLIFIVFKSKIQILISSYSRIEYLAKETGGQRMYLLMIISTLLGVIYRKPFINKNQNNKYLFYMMISSTIIMPITRFNPVIMRLYFYFFVFMIIYIPNILNCIKNKIVRIAAGSIYLVIGFTWFFTSVIHVEQLEYYLFFWQ